MHCSLSEITIKTVKEERVSSPTIDSTTDDGSFELQMPCMESFDENELLSAKESDTLPRSSFTTDDETSSSSCGQLTGLNSMKHYLLT